MQTVAVDGLDLFQATCATDPRMRVRAAFPISCETGSQSTAVVYFELEPGERLGRHTDSAEEILLVLAGRGEATVGDERGPVEAGTLAVVPALVPHAVENTGDETLRIVGFFSSNTVLSVFEEPLQPFGTRVFVTPAVEDEAEVAAGARG